MVMVHKEYNECVLIHNWLEWRNIPHTHVANETGGNFRLGAMNKRIGVSAGFPDYLIFLSAEQNKNNVPVNIAIEVKEPSGKNKPTKLQQEWLKILSAQGFEVGVCYGFQEFHSFMLNIGYKDTEIRSAKELF